MAIIKTSKNHLVWNSFNTMRSFSAQQTAEILSYGVFSRSAEADAAMKQEMLAAKTTVAPAKPAPPKQD